MKIALVDCNSFYASCETVFRPDLRNRPVVVLSNNDGCIVSLNQPAKDLGLERTTPVYQVKAQIQTHGVAVFSSNYALYADFSRRVQSIYRDFTPLVEDYSIDESFLFFPSLAEIPLAAIKQKVERWTGIPVSVGATKTLAKVANKLSKKRGAGCFEITDENRQDVLRDFPLEKVWGIGPATSQFLNDQGFKFAGQFAALDPAWVKKKLGLNGWKSQQELLGTAQIDREEAQVRGNLLFSRSFSHLVTDRADLGEAVAEYAALAAEKLRAQGCTTELVQVFLATNFFREEEPQYCPSILIKLPVATSYSPTLVGAALKGLSLIFKPGFRYKKAGVMLLGLEKAGRSQGNLFYPRALGQEALQKAVDRLNQTYGAGTVRCHGQRASADWMMSRESLSPCYTTRWKDLPRVNEVRG